MALILKHQTTEAFVSRVREIYRNGDPHTLLSVARFITARIQSGDLTNQQLRTAFGMNAGQWSALLSRMTALINADNTVKSAMGE